MTDRSPHPKPLDQCRDVHDFLASIRPRPGLVIRQGRLQDLEMLLLGYSVALEVHGVDELFALEPTGAFAMWLAERHGWSMSLGWASAITRHTDGEDPVTVFFRLYDEYRSEQKI